MKKTVIKGLSDKSVVLTGEKIENTGQYLPEGNVYIITDTNINALYKDRFPKFPVYIIEPGDKSKTLQTAAGIYRWLLDAGADRTSFILGIGGGVVCDLAGFIASTFMRGIDFGFVATSLLAQVDASIGGKNGVNLDGYKNIVGTFNQPQFVLCDISMLKTLPKDEFINGFAEIVKHSLIADSEMFSYIEENVNGMKSVNTDVLEYLVSKSVKIKADIVMADEREKNIRRKLNLGHTFGHAVEKATGISHGKAVSIGITYAASVSVEKGLLNESEFQRIINLLKNLDLPVSWNEDTGTDLIFDAISKDKKKTGDHIDFVLMNGIGDVVIEKLSIKELKKI